MLDCFHSKGELRNECICPPFFLLFPLLFSGFWFLVSGFWFLVSGFWLLVAGCWPGCCWPGCCWPGCWPSCWLLVAGFRPLFPFLPSLSLPSFPCCCRSRAALDTSEPNLTHTTHTCCQAQSPPGMEFPRAVMERWWKWWKWSRIITEFLEWMAAAGEDRTRKGVLGVGCGEIMCAGRYVRVPRSKSHPIESIRQPGCLLLLQSSD